MNNTESEKAKKEYFVAINKVGLVVAIFVLILTIITAILAVWVTFQFHSESINSLLSENNLISLTLPVIAIPFLGFLIWLIFLIRKLWKRINYLFFSFYKFE
jgi:hypothetical protein